MSSLVIGPIERDMIFVLRRVAAAQPFDARAIEHAARTDLARSVRPGRAYAALLLQDIGDDLAHQRHEGVLALRAASFRDMMLTQTIVLPVGFRVCYSHEIQPDAPPPGLCAHISISVTGTNRVPSKEAVEMILQEFGMRPLRRSDGVWVEDVDADCKAINVLQLLRASPDHPQGH